MKLNENLFEEIKQKYEEDLIARNEYILRHPPDVPNKEAHYAFIRGLTVENSFMPVVGEFNYLCETEYEKIYIWTFRKNTVSALVSDTDYNKVKSIKCWKTFAQILDLSLVYMQAFESSNFEGNDIDYKWMYFFSFENTSFEEVEFANLTEFEKKFIKDGRTIKATDISNIADIMELLNRDDKAFTALSLLYSAFRVNNCCLICELSDQPFHDHLTDEPEIWQQMGLITNLEMAIVASCRSVESVLGEPPNRKKQSKVIQFKQRFKNETGIDPDEFFEKGNMSYLDFYYKLFFDFRNPSAHSYGDIHFELKRKEAVAAQCFAALVVKGYINNNMISMEKAVEKFKFNNGFLDRVQTDCSIFITKND